MKTIKTKVVATVSLSLVLAIAPAFAQKVGQSVKISTGIVQSAQSVKLQSEAGTGALVAASSRAIALPSRRLAAQPTCAA